MSGSIQTSQPETGSAPRAPRFTLRYLFLLTAVVALALLPVTFWEIQGLLPACWIGVTGMFLIHRKHYHVALMACLSVIAMCMLPAVNAARTPCRRSECCNNMRVIAFAILAYEQVNGHLPPPYTVDDNGNPLHSWRVLLLPYLEHQALYDSLDLSKPWHHPDNLALADQMPDIFRCPSFRVHSQGKEVTTAYVAITGDRTAWPRSGVRKIEDIVDGASNTLLLVECEKHRLHWMSTVDPDMQMIGPLDGAGTTMLSHGPHGDGSHLIFADRRTVYAYKAPSKTLRATATIDGGEQVDLPDR